MAKNKNMARIKLLSKLDRLITGLFVLIICFLLFLSAASFGQNVGINNPTPDASALLDLTSSDKGILVPRMSTAQRTAISSPATGLLVYDTSTNDFWFYDGSSWRQMLGDLKGWSTTGNANTIDGVNFLGTTDNVPFNFRVNNKKGRKN
ncbi:MAG: hypothetical protein IPJ79_11870 [Bacteroidetes bacterium]|nr:hypothetical protein [Bacteroidota bacterium]